MSGGTRSGDRWDRAYFDAVLERWFGTVDAKLAPGSATSPVNRSSVSEGEARSLATPSLFSKNTANVDEADSEAQPLLTPPAIAIKKRTWRQNLWTWFAMEWLKVFFPSLGALQTTAIAYPVVFSALVGTLLVNPVGVGIFYGGFALVRVYQMAALAAEQVQALRKNAEWNKALSLKAKWNAYLQFNNSQPVPFWRLQLMYAASLAGCLVFAGGIIAAAVGAPVAIPAIILATSVAFTVTALAAVALQFGGKLSWESLRKPFSSWREFGGLTTGLWTFGAMGLLTANAIFHIVAPALVFSGVGSVVVAAAVGLVPIALGINYLLNNPKAPTSLKVATAVSLVAYSGGLGALAGYAATHATALPGLSASAGGATTVVAAHVGLGAVAAHIGIGAAIGVGAVSAFVPPVLIAVAVIAAVATLAIFGALAYQKWCKPAAIFESPTVQAEPDATTNAVRHSYPTPQTSCNAPLVRQACSWRGFFDAAALVRGTSTSVDVADIVQQPELIRP